MNSRNTFLGVLLAVTIGGGAMAGAAPESPPMEAVSYADLNLKSPVGVAKLYRRIQRAAEKVCKYPPAVLALVEQRESCKARATDHAVAQVGVPALDALHLARTRGNSRPEQVATNR